jgi:hypothetical protein
MALQCSKHKPLVYQTMKAGRSSGPHRFAQRCFRTAGLNNYDGGNLFPDRANFAKNLLQCRTKGPLRFTIAWFLQRLSSQKRLFSGLTCAQPPGLSGELHAIDRL